MESLRTEGQLAKEAPGLLDEAHLRAILKTALVSEISSKALAERALLGLRALRWRARVDQALFNGPAALQTVTVLLRVTTSDKLKSFIFALPIYLNILIPQRGLRQLMLLLYILGIFRPLGGLQGELACQRDGCSLKGSQGLDRQGPRGPDHTAQLCRSHEACCGERKEDLQDD